ncbi:SusD/RagB family nutrient-binding outer membrane lipoprotein [Sphingobacterium faecium]|uniref:SusD/RagB family nutrient-binding outer membrane lipoprotein n=1 Tax=Sphingobacterium faecium TaxID=34087 RepID=UPI003207A1BB
MKKINRIMLFSLFSLTLASCKKDMVEMNTNEELLVSTDPKFVFTNATLNWNNASRGDLAGKYSGVMQLMQYIVGNNGGSDAIYANPTASKNPTPYLPYYNYYYNNYGNKLNYLISTVIENRIDKDRFKNIAAIAKILQTYQAFLVFDTHGAAPYADALQGLLGNSTPKYDMYEENYKLFDNLVKESVALLNSKPADQIALGNNDFFYRGDVNKWIKFGNTLRIKMAQRFEKVDNAHFQSVLTDVLANPGGLIASNAESCIYYHNIEHNNDTWDTAVLTYQYLASNAFVTFLESNSDPRLPLLVRRNGFGTGNNNPDNDAVEARLKQYHPNYSTDAAYKLYTDRYIGRPASPDLSTDEKYNEYVSFNETTSTGPVSYTVRAISQIQSRYFVKNGGNAETAGGARNIDYPRYDNNDEMKLFSPQITYAEVCFMMAEISEKAGASKGGKDAKTWYESGIRASMEQYQEWGVRMKVLAAANNTASDYNPIDNTKIDQYLAQPQVQYTGSQQHKLELIISQAWVNFFMRPEEAWATWKRTGLPKFKNFTQANPADGTAFLDEIKSGGTTFLIPRRSTLPVPNAANNNNYNEALNKLIANPLYLEQNKTEGRIFWDVQ